MGGQSRSWGVKTRPCMTDEKTDTGETGNWPEVTHLVNGQARFKTRPSDSRAHALCHGAKPYS